MRLVSETQPGNISSKVATVFSSAGPLKGACAVSHMAVANEERKGLLHVQVPQGAGILAQQVQKLCRAATIWAAPPQRMGCVVVDGHHRGVFVLENRKRKTFKIFIIIIDL